MEISSVPSQISDVMLSSVSVPGTRGAISIPGTTQGNFQFKSLPASDTIAKELKDMSGSPGSKHLRRLLDVRNRREKARQHGSLKGVSLEDVSSRNIVLGQLKRNHKRSEQTIKKPARKTIKAAADALACFLDSTDSSDGMSNLEATPRAFAKTGSVAEPKAHHMPELEPELAHEHEPESEASPDPEPMTVPTCEHFRTSVRLDDVKMMLDACNGSLQRCTQCSCKPSELWLCLTCGHVGCGGKDNKHGEAHARARNHFIALRVEKGSCYCFSCAVCISGQSDALTKIQSILQRADTRQPVAVAPPSIFRGKTGLSNFGNSCFMNAVIQALASTNELRRHVIKHPMPPQIMRIMLPTIDGGMPSPKLERHRAPHRKGGGQLAPAPRSVRLLQNVKAPSPLPGAGQAPKSMYAELAILMSRMWNPSSYSNGVHEPTSFFCAVQTIMPYFGGYKQHDAHEFLRNISDRITWEFHEGARKMLKNAHVVDLSKPAPVDGGISPFSSLFGLSLLSEIECTSCHHVSCKVEAGQDISLDIPRMNKSIRICSTKPVSLNVAYSKSLGKHVPVRRSSRGDAAAATAAPNSGPVMAARSCRLVDCLRSFTKTEQLSEGFKCCSCSQNICTKRITLLKLPSVLCLHLKRFHWNFTSYGKLDRHVQFPMRNLNVREFYSTNAVGARTSSGSRSPEDGEEGSAKRMRIDSTDEPPEADKMYDLYAVVVHHGHNFEFGHYTAYCKNHEDGRWYHFNDSVVTPVDEEVVARCEAYLLFYTQNANE